MYERISTVALLSALTLINPACVAAREAVQAESAPAVRTAQGQGFIAVPGADLKSRMDEAVRRGRAGSKSAPFWVAYGFDVRPGIAIDLDAQQFNGSMSNFSGVTVFTGKVNGSRVETRNLGVFLLHDPQGNAVTRAEIYNLERKQEYANYPVYWLGRAGNDESLNYLLGLAESARPVRVAETATLALAAHDDGRVGGMLRQLVRQSKRAEVRRTAVFGLGHVGGEHAFLSELVRDEREDRELREAAAHAIGITRDGAALATLQSLYGSLASGHVRAALVHSAAHNEDEAGASAFLLRVARTDRDRDVKQQATHRLGQFDNEQVVGELVKIYAADRDGDVRQGVLHALSQMKSQSAHARLLEIARAGDDVESRGQAIHWLGQRPGREAFDDLMAVYNADRNLEIRQRILHSLSQMEDPRALDKLFEVARSGEDSELRQQATHWLAQKAGDRSLAALRDAANSSDADTEVQLQAVHAINQRPAGEAVPLLMELARTHRNPEVRRAAIHHLSRSGDPRALEFIRELLLK